MSKTKVLVVGFGRMGLSHTAVVAGILGAENVDFVVCDTSFFSRKIASVMVRGVRFVSLSDLKKNRYLIDSFDYILLTAPPFLRAEFLELLDGFGGRVFIEKPVLVELQSNQMSGYVIQHAPLNSRLRTLLLESDIRQVTARLTTNASFSSIKTGWRSKSFGSVLHEFGGHVLSMLGSVLPEGKIFNSKVDGIGLTVTDNTRDKVIFSFVEGDVNYTIELIAGSTEVRKASYDVEVETASGCIYYDLYTIKSESVGYEDVSLPETGTSVSFYVRGFEFTRQMEAFLEGEMDVLSRPQIRNMEEILMAVGETR